MTRTKTRALANWPNNAVSVKDFGATGDGVTDDALLLGCYDIAAGALGNAVYFPAGNYAVDLDSLGASLTMSTSWIGEDKYTTRITRKDWNPSTVSYIVSTSRSRNLTLKGITFDGQVSGSASSKPNEDIAAPGLMAAMPGGDNDAWSQSFGVVFSQCKNIQILDCDFKNFFRAGLRVEGGWPANADVAGTYVIQGSNVINYTCSSNHGYSTGDVVWIKINTGQIESEDGISPVSTYYPVTVTSPNSFSTANTLGQPTNVATNGTFTSAIYAQDDDEVIDNNYRLGKNVIVSNCAVHRTRGIFGDSFFFFGIENLFLDNLYAYDYQRIAFTFEFREDFGGQRMPCKNVVMTNCISEFGHDAIQAENNIGVWIEVGAQFMFENCSMINTGCGYALSTNKIYTDTTFDGPADMINLVNCNSRATQRGVEIVASDRSITFNFDNCQFESNQYAAPYAYLYRGYACNMAIRYYNSITGSVNDRFVTNITNCDFKNIGWEYSNYYATIDVSHGESTSDDNIDRNTINITNCTVEWLTVDPNSSGYIQNKAAVEQTWEQGGGGSDVSKHFYHFGDIVFSGSVFVDGNRGGTSMYIGRLNVDNFRNLTTDYLMTSLESRSSKSVFKFDHSSLSVTRGQAPASTVGGALVVNGAGIFDYRGSNLPRNLVKISDSIIKDANPNNTDRSNILSTRQLIVNSCQIFRPIAVQPAGSASATTRPLYAIFNDNHFLIDVITEKYMLSFITGAPLYSHLSLANNIFQYNKLGVDTFTLEEDEVPSTRAMAGDEVCIDLPGAPTAIIFIIGTGNIFDQSVAHVCRVNNTPTFNDAPDVTAVPWDYMPVGYLNYFNGA